MHFGYFIIMIIWNIKKLHTYKIHVLLDQFKEPDENFVPLHLPFLCVLQVTDSGKKNELLFAEFNTNYNKEPEIYKKGSVLFKQVC